MKMPKHWDPKLPNPRCPKIPKHRGVKNNQIKVEKDMLGGGSTARLQSVKVAAVARQGKAFSPAAASLCVFYTTTAASLTRPVAKC